MQLNLSWGDSKHPNCRGMTAQEIAMLDFSKLDLSEVYDQPVQGLGERLQQKLEALKTGIERRLSSEVQRVQG